MLYEIVLDWSSVRRRFCYLFLIGRHSRGRSPGDLGRAAAGGDAMSSVLALGLSGAGIGLPRRNCRSVKDLGAFQSGVSGGGDEDDEGGVAVDAAADVVIVVVVSRASAAAAGLFTLRSCGASCSELLVSSDAAMAAGGENGVTAGSLRINSSVRLERK